MKLTVLQLETFFAYIYWSTNIKIPEELKKKISDEQGSYTGEGYQELQSYINSKLVYNEDAPSFLTAIGIIESAEKMVHCAFENLDEAEIKDGIDFSYNIVMCSCDCKGYKRGVDWGHIPLCQHDNGNGFCLKYLREVKIKENKND